MTTLTDDLTLSMLKDDERYQRFDALQRRMPDVWTAMRLNRRASRSSSSPR